LRRTLNVENDEEIPSIMRTRFITSAASIGAFPKLDLPEFAFVGRSNVGKSSLLNGLTGSRIARTSKTPGRTQLVNFFEVTAKHGAFVLADLPGYGYARAPTPVRETWRRLIGAYLDTRESLRAVLLLFDLRREVAEEDRAFHRSLVDTVEPRGAAVLVVGTKCDQLPKAKLRPTLSYLARSLGLSADAVLATSASKHVGLDALRERIERLAGARGS
jgi:GTP-binding protein